MALFSKREPWPYKCIYCKSSLQHKPGSDYCYCPKCDCEMVKSEVIRYWSYQDEQVDDQDYQDDGYYRGYDELVAEARRKGDTRRVFLNINDTSLTPFQHSVRYLNSFAGNSYNYLVNSFSYVNPYGNSIPSSYQVIGYFEYNLDADRSSKTHIHYNCIGHFTIHSSNWYANQHHLQTLKNHVQTELTNLFYSDSKNTFDHKVREHLDWWKSAYYGFDDFDYSNITWDLSLKIEYRCAN